MLYFVLGERWDVPEVSFSEAYSKHISFLKEVSCSSKLHLFDHHHHQKKKKKQSENIQFNISNVFNLNSLCFKM